MALLVAVECIISFASDSTPSESFHNFTISWNNLEPTCYGTVLEMWIQILGLGSGLIQSVSWTSSMIRWIKLLGFTKLAPVLSEERNFKYQEVEKV